MNQKLIVEIGKSQRLQIINQLKRTQGLTVGELANRLKMSYMGIKQHCIELSGKGYLDTMRRPKQIGRPEMVYRLTERARELFPVASNETTLALLEAAQKLFGISASEKLLLLVFQKKEEQYRKKIRGDSPTDRMKSLAKLRDAEGCMTDFEADENGARIVEHHSPIADLAQAYPFIARLETEIFQRLLGIAVTRSESRVSGLYSCVFNAPELASKSVAENEVSPEEAFAEPVFESSSEIPANDEVAEVAFVSDEKMTVSDEGFSPEIESDLESREDIAAIENEEVSKSKSSEESFVEPIFEPSNEIPANHKFAENALADDKNSESELLAEPFTEPVFEEAANPEIAKILMENETVSAVSEIQNSPNTESEIVPFESANDEVAESEFVDNEMIQSPVEHLPEPIPGASANDHLSETEQTDEASSPLAVVENESLEIENAPMENAPEFLPAGNAISLTTMSEIESEKTDVAQEESATVSSEVFEVKTPEEPLRIGIRKLPKVKPKPLVRRNPSPENQPDLFSL